MCASRALSAAGLVLTTHQSTSFLLWLMSAFRAANGVPFAALALQDAACAYSAPNFRGFKCSACVCNYLCYKSLKSTYCETV
jgi:hypothetical protein